MTLKTALIEREPNRFAPAAAPVLALPGGRGYARAVTSPRLLVDALCVRFPEPRALRDALRLRPAPPPRTVLDTVRFEAGPGEVVALLGANGAGKSTLLRVLAGLVAPTSGRVEISPTPALGLADERSFHWRLTVQENLAFFAALQGADAGRIPALLAEVGLADRAATPVRACSTGMRARLGMARALLRDPAILLLDEVERGLDPPGRHWLADFLETRRRRGGTLTLVATHDTAPGAAERFTRALLFDAGRLVHDGPPAPAFARLEGRP